MFRHTSRAGFMLIFSLALIDASQDLLHQQRVFSPADLAVVGVALAAALPLVLVGLGWRAARRNPLLSSLLAALYFLLVVVLTGTWAHQVFLGEAAPEGAAQMHLLFFPVLSTVAALVGLLGCYLGVMVLTRVRRVR
jgi:hypothetical protein